MFRNVPGYSILRVVSTRQPSTREVFTFLPLQPPGTELAILFSKKIDIRFVFFFFSLLYHLVIVTNLDLKLKDVQSSECEKNELFHSTWIPQLPFPIQNFGY